MAGGRGNGPPKQMTSALPPGGVFIDPGRAGRPESKIEWEIGSDPAAPGGLQFEPLRDNLAVRVIKVVETAGGVVLTEGDAFRSPRALVLAAGPDCKQVKVGDVVHFPPPPHTAMAHPLTRNTGGFLVIDEKSVLGIDRRALGPNCEEPPRPDGRLSEAYRVDDHGNRVPDGRAAG